MSEREKFMARLAEAKKAGLVVEKFFFRPTRAFEPEEIFAAMNKAAKVGMRHSGWNGNEPA